MADNVQDITLRVLRQIRDEIVSTRVELRTEIGKTNDRLDTVNERLGTSNERLGHVETTLGGMQTVLVDLAGQQAFTSRYVRTLASRDRDLAADVDELRTRLDALERRTPG